MSFCGKLLSKRHLPGNSDVRFAETQHPWNSPRALVVKTLPSKAGGVGSIPGPERARIPHACGQKTKTWNRSDIVANSITTLEKVQIKENLQKTKQNIKENHQPVLETTARGCPKWGFSRAQPLLKYRLPGPSLTPGYTLASPDVQVSEDRLCVLSLL